MTRYLITPAIADAWGCGPITAPAVTRAHAPEEALIEWARQFIDPRKRALDVGAHVGSWCLTLGAAARRWDAFEPDPTSHACLTGGIVLNDLVGRVYAHPVALGHLTGHAALTRVSPDGGGNRLATVGRPARWEGAPAGPLCRVELAALDRFDNDPWPDVGFIKIDAEGSELAILQGAVKTLEASRWPVICLECWTEGSIGAPAGWAKNAAELWAYVVSLGYKRTAINGWPEMWLLERGA